jgi:hypothetical protein
MRVKLRLLISLRFSRALSRASVHHLHPLSVLVCCLFSRYMPRQYLLDGVLKGGERVEHKTLQVGIDYGRLLLLLIDV